MDGGTLKARVRLLVEEQFEGNATAAARAAKLNPTYVRDLLESDQPNPRAVHLAKLGAGLRVSVAYLLGETDIRDPKWIQGAFTAEARAYLEALQAVAEEDRELALDHVKLLAARARRPAPPAAALPAPVGSPKRGTGKN
jgi:hypothetical protein